MSFAEASLVVVSVFFSLYALTSAIGTGIALDMIFKPNSKTRARSRPMWEIANVFLVFGFTALAMVFSKALPKLSSALLSTLAVALIALLLRACSVLVLFYGKPDKASRFWLWLFGIASLAVPLTFAAAGVYLLTGELFWSSILGASLMLAALFSQLGLGWLFSDGSYWLGKLAFTAWMLVLGCFLPLAAIHTENTLILWPIAAILALAAIGLAGILWIKKRKLERYLAAKISLLVIPLLAWSNHEYLVAGKIKLEDAFSAATYGGGFIIGALLMLPLLAFGFWLFYQLLGTEEQ